LFIDRNSQALKVLQRIRDEAHRFGITFHRSLRSKGQIHSELLDIEGVGEATEAKLIRRFKSVARVKKASLEDLTAAVGKKMAQTIYQHFNS
ncbi:MAG: excinuclease ABC subunit C, partial [Bacteroidales bacterium]|nr:excinuclease ABC subunit C [Bacteroidales bacterium]